MILDYPFSVAIVVAHLLDLSEVRCEPRGSAVGRTLTVERIGAL